MDNKTEKICKETTKDNRIVDGEAVGEEIIKNEQFLQGPWCVYYDYQNLQSSMNVNASKWIGNIQKVCTIDSVESLKGLLESIERVGKWPVNSNIQIFRKGIKPAWEDPFNEGGRRIVYQIDCSIDDEGQIFEENTGTAFKNITDSVQDIWEKTIKFCLFEILEDSGINGCVFSPRRNYIRISVWVRKDVDHDNLERRLKEYADYRGKSFTRDFSEKNTREDRERSDRSNRKHHNN